MRRFRFPLDGLLKVRRIEEQEAEQQLRQAQERLQAAETVLAQALAAESEALGVWRQLLGREASAGELLLAAQHLSVLERRRHFAEQKVKEAQDRVLDCLEAYRDRRRQRELVEELRKKEWQRWLMEWSRSEQIAADERALRDFAVAQMESER